jgi:hypothetical protein
LDTERWVAWRRRAFFHASCGIAGSPSILLVNHHPRPKQGTK